MAQLKYFKNNNLLNDNSFPCVNTQIVSQYYAFPTPHKLKLLNIQAYQQTEDYTCGPAAVMSLMQFYGMLNPKEMTHETELRIAKEMGVSKEFGASPQQIAAWLVHHDFAVESGVNGTVDMLRENVQQGIPTLVEWIDWGGHWAVMTGYYMKNSVPNENEDTLLLADPSADEGNFKSINGIIRFKPNRFASMWFDAQYINPGQIVRGVYIVARPR